jgi:hypothetical protein
MEISVEKGPATAGDFPVAFHTSVSSFPKMTFPMAPMLRMQLLNL